jgi:hypothetical protein
LQQNTVANFSMKMEGRIETNGNQEKGEEEKEALSCFQCEVKQGTRDASPKFFGGRIYGL